MRLARVEGVPAMARWTGRIALFSAVLLVFSLVAHRFFGMATPVFLKLVQLALAGAALSLALGVVVSIRIWRFGGTGLARVLTAFVVGGAMWAWPLSYVPVMKRLPELNDVSTDIAAPPAFEVLAAARAAPANGPAYDAQRFAERQLAGFPDLVPLRINRSCEETFDLVVDAVRRQRMSIMSEVPPSQTNGRVGRLEAVDRTMIVGFYDDVSVRVSGDDSQAVVAIRSASRFGRHDLGRNVRRVRDLLHEIVVRLESTIPGAAENRRRRKKEAEPEEEERPSARKGAGRRKEAPRRQ